MVVGRSKIERIGVLLVIILIIGVLLVIILIIDYSWTTPLGSSSSLLYPAMPVGRRCRHPSRSTISHLVCHWMTNTAARSRCSLNRSLPVCPSMNKRHIPLVSAAAITTYPATVADTSPALHSMTRWMYLLTV
jgi:hypothetical protein